MSSMKWFFVITSSVVIAYCVAESRNIDDVYKNHRISRNDTQNPMQKYPMFPAQVYANLSNIQDFTSIKRMDQPNPTEASLDGVRMFITPENGKKKRDPTVPTTEAYVVSSSFKTSSTSTQSVHQKSRSPTVTEDESKRKLGFNGTKIRRVLKTQSQGQTNLLYASTQLPPVANSRDTIFPITTKVNSTSASKPFATVLVPKQMLNGDQVDYIPEDSFRPMASPTFSYKQNVDTNSVIENRRDVNRGVTQTASPPKLTKFGFTKPDAIYQVVENTRDQGMSSGIFDKGFNDRDRIDQIYLPAESPKTDKLKRDQVKFDHSKPIIVQHGTPKYGYPIPESYQNVDKHTFKNVPPSDQYREFYPAIQSPQKDVKLPYNSAGTFDMRLSPTETPFEYEKSSVPPKEFSSPPTWFTSTNPEKASSGSDFAMDDVKAKDVLTSLLRDMLKSKQQSEIKPNPPGVGEIIDSYFKTNRPNVDFSLDNYNIETDMSCNLRSTKHISDGQCVTTKPVVEAVCADRCLVYAPTTRQRLSSSLAGQQVEALHCVDGDVKFVRVQLLCEDGNKVNNVIKVVTNCRCKLHQVQPQMRSNIPGSGSSLHGMGMPNQDIMNIAAGNF